MENMKCYLCGSTEFERLDGVVRDNPSLEVLQCKNCSLVFLSSFEHINDEFYCEDGMHGGNVDIEKWVKETKFDDRRRYNFLKNIVKGKSVLDFGCGNGGFLSRIKKKAQFAKGVELQKSMQEHYSKNDLKVFSNIDEVDEKFDFITLFHVLEHIKDPIELLKQLGAKLNENGQIIIEVPNANDALITLYKNYAFMNFTYWSCHLYLFNEITLLDLVQKAGFKINYIKQVQRYGFANHLYWQIAKKPGGHKKLWFINCRILNKFYEKALSSVNATDTLIVSISNNI